MLDSASHLGIRAEVLDLKDREEMMKLSPTPYGIYSVVYQCQLVTFHRLTIRSGIRRLQEIGS
jgi:hypothetical protein